MPVIVTVCAVFQFTEVNLTSLTETEPSVISDELTGITTSAVGSDVSIIVNVAVVPASEVLPDTADTAILAISLSNIVIVDAKASTSSYSLLVTRWVIFATSSIASKSSFTVIVTLLSSFHQLSGVNFNNSGTTVMLSVACMDKVTYSAGSVVILMKYSTV